MKFIHRIALLLAGSIFYLQQPVAQTITVGTPYTTVKGPTVVLANVPTKVFRKDNVLVQIKQAEKFQICIQRIDLVTMKEISKKFFMHREKSFFITTLEIKGKVYIVFSTPGGMNGKKGFEFFAYEIDLKSGTINPEEILLVKDQNDIDPFSLWFSFDYTADSTRILLRHAYKGKGKDQIIQNLVVLNKDLGTISMRSFEIPGPGWRYKFVSNACALDNSDNAVFLVKVYEDKKACIDVVKDKIAFHYELIQVKPDGSIEMIPLKESNRWIKNMQMIIMPSGEFYCIGGYSNSAEYKQASVGIALYKLGDNGKMISKDFVEIPLEIMAMYESPKDQKDAEKKGSMERTDLYTESVVLHADGALTLVTRERHYTFDQVNTYINGGCLLLVKLDAGHKLVWARKNPVWTSGYQYFLEKGVHYIVQKDIEKNKDLGPKDEAFGVAHADEFWLSASMIDDKTGELTKKYLVNLANINGLHVYKFMEENMICISRNNIVFEVYKKGDKDVLIRLGID